MAGTCAHLCTRDDLSSLRLAKVAATTIAVVLDQHRHRREGQGLRSSRCVQELLWIAGFLVFGGLFGRSVAGNQGPFAFAIAFLVFPLAFTMFFIAPSAFRSHFPYSSATALQAVDAAALMTFNSLAFGAAGAIGMAIATNSLTVTWNAAKNGAFNGFLGGLILAGTVPFLGLRDPFFIVSLAIPAFLSGRRLRILFTLGPRSLGSFW